MDTEESFPSDRSSQGITPTTHPHVVLRNSYTSTPPYAFMACKGTILTLPARLIKLAVSSKFRISF
jgi:hypothetical protein